MQGRAAHDVPTNMITDAASAVTAASVIIKAAFVARLSQDDKKSMAAFSDLLLGCLLGGETPYWHSCFISLGIIFFTVLTCWHCSDVA